MMKTSPQNCGGGDGGAPAKPLPETPARVAGLARASAKSFFEIVLQQQGSGGGQEINFAQILEHADRFNRAFQDAITQQWNDFQGKSSGGGGQVDYSQHCDTDEDEVFENSLYQPCPDGPIDGLNEPVYENSEECSDYQSSKFRQSDSSQSLGDVTPTPPTESHYSTMHETDSPNLYDSPPPASALEEQLRSRFANQEQKPDSPAAAGSRQNPGTPPQKPSPPGGKKSSPTHQLQEDLQKKMLNMQLNFANKKPPSPVHNGNPQTEQQSGKPGGGLPKLKSSMVDVDSPELKKKEQQCRAPPVKPDLVVKKESVLEIRLKSADTGQSSWQTCRLVMGKTHGGMLINVYTPPDSDAIHASIFCSMIYEIGEATEAQYGKTADRILVVKAQDSPAVTLRARNYEDKHDWICSIRENTDAKTTKRVFYDSADQLSPMTPTQEMYDRNMGNSYSGEGGGGGGEMKLSRRSSTSSNNSSSHYSRDSMERGQSQYVTAAASHVMKEQAGGGFDRQMSVPNPPTFIYQDGAVYQRQNSVPGGKAGSMANIADQQEGDKNIPRMNSCGNFQGPPQQMGSSGGYPRSNPIEQLKSYPWFHGKLPREKASKMVLSNPNPEAGHGIYLVRQSENNDSEFTLTFNYEGKAKHLRMYVDGTTGVCQVQHLPYKSLYHMIEHHRRNPLPIDIKGSSPITLKSYITNFGAGGGGGNPDMGGGGGRGQDHRRNKSVDFSIDRNTELGPPQVARHTSLAAQFGGQATPVMQRQNSRPSNGGGVYYSQHS